MKLSQLFKSKTKDKFKTATGLSVKGLAKDIRRLELKGFKKYGEMAKEDYNGTTLMYQQVMVKKVSEEK